MPLRSFWTFNAQVGRLRAEENLAQMDLFLLGSMNMDGKNIEVMRRTYLNEMGEPMKTAPVDPQKTNREIHQAGVAKLKTIAARLQRA